MDQRPQLCRRRHVPGAHSDCFPESFTNCIRSASDTVNLRNSGDQNSDTTSYQELLVRLCAFSQIIIPSRNTDLASSKGNTTAANWNAAFNDVKGALASGGYAALLQVSIFSRNQTGAGSALLQATANVTPPVTLPYTYFNGTSVVLGDSGTGYPPSLYPNITYNTTSDPDPMDPAINATFVEAFLDFPFNSTSALLLGPFQINDTFALVSLTLPIVDNTAPNIVLAYMTIVAAASSLIDVVQSREGLANTGLVLLVGPNRRENQFRYQYRPATATYTPSPNNIRNATVHYIFPPVPIPGQIDRHTKYNSNLTQLGSSNFTESAYPAIVAGFGNHNPAINNASSMLSTTNENNVTVAVGYARPASTLVEWLLIIEQSHDEAWAPITTLRKIVLACVLGTMALILVVALPMAHYSVRPIRRLRDATEKSIAPPGYTPDGSIRPERLNDPDEGSGDEVGDEENIATLSQSSKKPAFFIRLRRLTNGGKRMSNAERTEADRRRVFKIPGKVQDRKHCITDELTE